MEGNDASDRPVVELFVKAAVDKMKNGGCPICHRYFMMFYILREQGLIDLVVTTFLPENPPKEVLEFSNGKHYPLVKVHKGVDSQGQDMTGVECDTVDEIESLVSRFDCDALLGRRENKTEDKAERTFEDLLKTLELSVFELLPDKYPDNEKLMTFLKGTTDNAVPLLRTLERIDAHLREENSRFMTGDVLSRADCYLLPTLQHLRVAGRAYKKLEIPTELECLWRYLRSAYDSDAFKESCPADREIITQYTDKASNAPHINVRKSQLLGEDRTFSTPAGVVGNGSLE